MSSRPVQGVRRRATFVLRCRLQTQNLVRTIRILSGAQLLKYWNKESDLVRAMMDFIKCIRRNDHY
jgi:hypothetical protein